MRVGKFSTLCAAALAIAGCTSTGFDESQRAFQLNSTRIAECERKEFATHRAKAECMNSADRALMPSLGVDADLLQYRMAKRTELAGRIDKGQISVARANAEIKRVYSHVQSERNRRVALRAQTVANIMQAQNQNDAMASMARSQARIADSLEDASQNRNTGEQRDPFLWARDYARQR